MQPAPSSANARNPYLFVMGCPRSGTTLLQRMLNSHPQLAVANDTHFIPKAIKGEHSDLPLTSELVAKVRNYHRFPRLGLDESAIERAASAATTYAGFVSALYDELGKLNGKPLAGEKTPDYVKRIPLLQTLFPESYLLHIYRDGRNVALSVLEWAHESKGPGRFPLWKEEPVAVCALWWRMQVQAGRKHGTATPQYLEICYEQLVEAPERELQRISDFVQLPYAHEMLEYNKGKQRSTPGLSAKKAWLPPTKGLRDWRTDLQADDLALFEALTGDLLTELGYERGIEQIPAPIQRRAERCKEKWHDDREHRAKKSKK